MTEKIPPIKTAMILAAGKGERMRPLTLHTPKPLLEVHGKPLIVHHIEHIRGCGIKYIVINTAYLGEKIAHFLGDGSRYNVELVYSHEPEPLETGGALNRALPLLGSSPFLLVNADVWLPKGFAAFLSASQALCERYQSVLGLVENPAHNLAGDFAQQQGQLVAKADVTEVSHPDACADKQITYTFSGVSIMSPTLISQYPKRRQKFALKEVFDWWIKQGKLGARFIQDDWVDIGTPERLKRVNKSQ